MVGTATHYRKSVLSPRPIATVHFIAQCMPHNPSESSNWWWYPVAILLTIITDHTRNHRLAHSGTCPHSNIGLVPILSSFFSLWPLDPNPTLAFAPAMLLMMLCTLAIDFEETDNNSGNQGGSSDTCEYWWHPVPLDCFTESGVQLGILSWGLICWTQA